MRHLTDVSRYVDDLAAGASFVDGAPELCPNRARLRAAGQLPSALMRGDSGLRA